MVTSAFSDGRLPLESFKAEKVVSGGGLFIVSTAADVTGLSGIGMCRHTACASGEHIDGSNGNKCLSL